MTTTNLPSSEIFLLVPEGDLPQYDLVPISEGGQTATTISVDLESSQDQSMPILNDSANLETAGICRNPNNHQPGFLPSNCFMSKHQSCASSLSKNVLAGMKKYFSLNDKMATYTDAVNSYCKGTISMMYAFVASKNADNDTYTFKYMLE